MAYVITQPCIGVKDASCADVCPTGAIHPGLEDPDFAAHHQLYINADTCIDCGACAAACPVMAIYEEAAVPQEWQSFIGINVDFFNRSVPERGKP